MHYTRKGWRTIHWACVQCLVRPMCTERCYKTYYLHQMCEQCGAVQKCEPHEGPCENVKTMQRYEYMDHIYGDIFTKEMIKHIEETSLIRLLKKSKGEYENEIWKSNTI